MGSCVVIHSFVFGFFDSVSFMRFILVLKVFAVYSFLLL